MFGVRTIGRIVVIGLLVTLLVFFKFTGAEGRGSSMISFSFLTDEMRVCFFNAASYYGVNPELLIAIAYVESKLNPRAINRNRNRSYDLGIMQINTSWISYLRRYKVDPRYVWDPCYNVYLGAMVLRHCMDLFGNTWRAVDCYNKGPRRAKSYSGYVLRVYDALVKLSSGFYKN